MRIWIDNDGCPKIVRELVFNAAKRRNLEVIVVGNSFLHLPPSSLFSLVRVSRDFDAADNYIIDNVTPGDLVITADVPCASKVVEKGATGLNPNGNEFNKNNVKEVLAMRNLMQELRSGGEIHGGPSGYGSSQKKKFADALERLLTQLTKNAAKF